MDYQNATGKISRGSMPDAEDEKYYYLFKKVSVLHATYQIRLLTFFAQKNNKKLIIRLPEEAKMGDSLRMFISEHQSYIRLERV